MGYIFFLGGMDAEMCEIRRILQERGERFVDKSLAWGAKASDYEEELKGLGKDDVPVLIELEQDIELPEHAVVVDHHGPLAGKGRPSSIEQVAELLGVKLSRWQKLIAANDKGWIDGMKEAGATEEEIQKIREYDRRCQGVTEEEERAAERAIRNLRKQGDIAIVEYEHRHVSPVMDRLYGKYENILVITPESINFSGRGDLVERLAKAFPGGWYGGNLPEKGFWGMGIKEERVILHSVLQMLGLNNEEI